VRCAPLRERLVVGRVRRDRRWAGVDRVGVWAGPDAKAAQGSGDVLEVPAEVLGAGGLFGRDDGLRAECRSDPFAQ
jgi:hypothetical protein